MTETERAPFSTASFAEEDQALKHAGAPRVVALAYAAGATLWIASSDWLLAAIFQSPTLMGRWSAAKGVLFVAITAALLYGLLRRYLRLCDQQAEKRRLAQQELLASEQRLQGEKQVVARLSAERDQAESRLRILLRAVEQSPASIVITDTNGRIDYVNPKFTQTTGYALDEVRGLNPRILKSGETDPEAYRKLWTTILSGREWRGEFHNRKKGGELFWESAAISPICDRAGRVTHFLAVKEDITDRKQAARALHESEEMYRTLVTASPDPILVLNRDGAVEFASPRAREVFGYAPTQRVAGLEMLLSVAPRDRVRAEANFFRAMEERRIRTDEYTLLRSDGTEFGAEVSVAPLRESGGRLKGLVVLVRDITARKLAEEKLHASEERFRQVVETIAEVFWIFDPRAQRVVYVSPSFEKIWGRRCEEVRASPEVWMQALHPVDRERMLEVRSAMQAGGKFDETYRIVRPDGSERWIRDQAFCVKDEAGAVARIVGVAEDITERKDIERQFLKAQRLEAIGTLASGVAHDMNNILAPMIVVPALLKERVRDPGDRQLLGMVEQSAQRGAGIVRQLLTFSRGATGERGLVQISHLTKEMLNIMRETFPREIAVQCTAVRELPPVNCDPTQIHQVLMNLCVNARDAMPQGGQLTVSVTVAELDENAGRLHHAARPGRYVLIAVEDTGHGIPPEIIDRIFDPFFTTKELGKGTGLGLSTVLGIVRGHDGFVLVESVPGRGSVFKVYLPAAESATPPSAAGSAPPIVAGTGELILVVDDEEPMREATRQLLEKNGYRVVLAADGREALAKFTPSVQLVLTDLMMPAMNGFALIRALRGLPAHLPIIAATGMGESVHEEALAEQGVTEILRKPFAVRVLIDAVQRGLRAPVPAEP